MYRYDQYDHEIVAARVDEFRDQVRRRLSGEITEDQFKSLRLMNGLYLQLHAYMLRVAVPYGTLDGRQMRMLAHIARKYDRGYGHFTTRQNIQYNWIRLEDAPDILAELATVEMHAIQTSGNCIRNISADHFAGAAADEVADPRPYAELLRQWSTFHPEFTHLPRKFKIAVIAADEDRAAMRFHDIGLKLVERDGVRGFEVYVGGGQGRTPMVAPLIREFVREEQLVSYCEACLRVYNRYGRRDNMYKARIKILVHEIGADAYRAQVEEEFAGMVGFDLDPPAAELQRIAAMFAPPAFADGLDTAIDRTDPEFALWIDRQTHPHKAPGHVSVTVSLKPIGGIPGDATADQIDVLADLAERYAYDELRVTHAQNIVLPHVAIRDLPALWAALDAAELATPNLDLVSDIIACPGLDYCSLANARSIPLAQKLSERFALAEQGDLGEVKLKISGCINACGHHHAGHIGILGVDRKGEENYQLSFGGSGGEDASVGRIVGPGFSEDGVVDAVERALTTYRTLREGEERFLDTYRRVGLDPFKAAIYA